MAWRHLEACSLSTTGVALGDENTSNASHQATTQVWWRADSQVLEVGQAAERGRKGAVYVIFAQRSAAPHHESLVVSGRRQVAEEACGISDLHSSCRCGLQRAIDSAGNAQPRKLTVWSHHRPRNQHRSKATSPRSCCRQCKHTTPTWQSSSSTAERSWSM